MSKHEYHSHTPSPYLNLFYRYINERAFTFHLQRRMLISQYGEAPDADQGMFDRHGNLYHGAHRLEGKEIIQDTGQPFGYPKL